MPLDEFTFDLAEYCADEGPFRAHLPKNGAWEVRGGRGQSVAFCEDEDGATAIAEALNKARTGAN